jgi:CheY-like chemotaxis protein
MKATDKTYYFHIPGLLIPKNTQHDPIHAKINNFINIIPDLIKSVEKNYAQLTNPRRKESFCSNMELLISLLMGVYARSLEMEAIRIVRCVRSENTLPAVEKLIRPFITGVLSLSIEMQKAQKLTEENILYNITESEFMEDMANDISTVGYFVNIGEYTKAESIVADLKEYTSDTLLIKLMNLITSKNYHEAEILSSEIKDKYFDTLTNNNITDNTKTVMAVDDRPEILSFVNNVLKTHYTVIAVNSGKMAEKALKTQKPDLFILDIDMPEMNGYTLAERIRNNPEHVNSPILFLTGNATREHVTKAIKAGCKDFIIKPVKPDVLLSKVNKFIKNPMQT